MTARVHFKDLSISLAGFGAPLQSLNEEATLSDEEDDDEKKCPNQFQVLQILKENDFENANEIAKQYQKYVEEEEYEKETLMDDLRDSMGSWLADSELKQIFEWNEEQTNKFKQLVLTLMVEKSKRVRVKTKRKTILKSLLKKNESRAFLDAFKKTYTEKSKKESTDHQQSMPTYMNRAIWFRSDDENLERLVDKAVKEVLSIDNIWCDEHFVNDIYDDNKFNACIEQIFKLKFKFFERFVTERYQRQLQLHALFEAEKDNKVNNNRDSQENEAKTKQQNSNYAVYYKIKQSKPDDIDIDIDENEEKKSEADGDDNLYEYHIYPKSMENDIVDEEDQRICSLYVDDKKRNGFEWSWWKRKSKGDLLRKAQQNAIASYGFWEILNNEYISQQNVEKNGVGVDHLNVIFELLRHYYAKSVKGKIVAAGVNDGTATSQRARTFQLELQNMTMQDPTLLSVIYCQGEFIPVKFAVDIYIHYEPNEEEDIEADSHRAALYELTWWNGAKKTDCYAIAIRNKTVMIEDSSIDEKGIKEKYYMRFDTKDVNNTRTNHKKGVVWHWYDNDHAQYQQFKDYLKTDAINAYKQDLLHKQLEAIFLSNIDTNYPWKLFDVYSPKTSKNNHSFNNAQITHLRPALEDNELHFNTIGYMARFVRLYASNDIESEFDLNIILNMEQVAITTEGTSFSRNIRRMKDGQNSLSFYYAGSNVFINHWLQNYLLSTKAQRLYFWSFILCIAVKIKQIDIEVENQLVTIPQYKAFISATKSAADTQTFDEGEVRDEQNDALLYEGFLVPPILDGEVAMDQAEGAMSKTTVQGLKKKVNNLSKTRILRKAKVKKQALKNVDSDTDNDHRFVWYQSLDGEQYRDSLGVMFRFAEIIRKFILESRHLGEDTSLWPYYKNYFHRNNHESYHTLINRFNLSLMFNRSDMFELLEEEATVEEKIGCFSHFSCTKYKENDVLLKESERMKSTEVAIRHQRKFAAQLLLQKWNSLRNLNILRHQLGPLFDNLLKKHGDEVEDEKLSDEELQIHFIDIAKRYNERKWMEMIQVTNKRLQKNLNNVESGWQLLTSYDIHRVDSIHITTKKYPFFESFMQHFVLNAVNEERELCREEMRVTEQSWYPLFKQSWTATPEWWSNNHDIVLMELALKYGDKWHKYGPELTGDAASNYMMRLRAYDEDDNAELSRQYIPGHTMHLTSKQVKDVFDSDIKDELRPYLEFQHWCRQKSNMLHRLKYITNKAILQLNSIKPSLVEIRIPDPKDRPKFSSQSLIFSQYEHDKHLEYIAREMKLTFVKNYSTERTLRAMKTARGKPDYENQKKEDSKKRIKRYKRQQETMLRVSADLSSGFDEFMDTKQSKTEITFADQTDLMAMSAESILTTKMSLRTPKTPHIPSEIPSPMSGNFAKRKSVALSRYQADESESDSSNAEFDDDEDDNKDASDEDATDIRIHDPFIHRNLMEELGEVIHAFNMIKYGAYMAKFIINEIKEFQMEELWDALLVVMEAIPFPMGLDILHSQMPHLRRSKPEQLFKVCREMVEGTNFGVAAALRMADYFETISKSDNFQGSAWKEKSVKFEEMAHTLINSIESDHLLYILLTIPLYDTSESMSILSLALEQKRVSFLNNDRILGVMRHVWYHSAAISVEDEIDTREFEWGQSLQILFFQPFKFYMSPVGFNWTIATLYLLYLVFVVLYSYFIVKGKDEFYIDIIFWLFNAGFVTYEVSEFSDKGRQYFSVTGIMNVWDIMISIVWMALFALYVLGRLTMNVSDNDIQDPTNSTAMFSTTEFEEEHLDFAESFNPSLRELYAFLWAIQLFLLSTRFLTLFQNTEYLGSMLTIVQRMFAEIVKFLSVACVVVAAYTVGFYFIFGFNRVNIIGEEGDDAQDFWPTVLFTFDEFIGGGTSGYHENTVVPLFAMVITIIGFLILTNLLIALMSTEYENFQEYAHLEVSYMWTETVYDLSHRDRLMPPPLNLLVYAVGIVTHILVWPFAVCCPTTKLNLYTSFNHNTYIWLDSFYCGCNGAVKHEIMSKSEYSPSDQDDKKNKKILQQQAKKIYSDRFNTFLSFSGWMMFRNCFIVSCIKKCFCPCKCVDECGVPSGRKKGEKGCCNGVKRTYRKCCCNDKDDTEASSLTAYHKGCYNCIKLRVKDNVTELDTTTIRGISMKQYIERFEDKRKTKLHKEDKILLKHLTVDTLFCNQCYQPYLEKDVNEVLLAPFRVLLDFISCFVFVAAAWLPLVIFFSVMSAMEYCKKRTSEGIHSKTATTGTNEYDSFDREYFPLPLNQIIDVK